MFSPSQRALLVAAVIIVPLSATSTLAPRFEGLCILLIALTAVATFVDALLGWRRSQSIHISAPSALKWFQGRQADLLVSIDSGALAVDALLAVEAPESIRVEQPATQVHVRGNQLFPVVCTPARRGDFRIDAAFVRIPSPLGLWNLRLRRSLQTEVRVYPDLQEEAGAKLLFRHKLLGARVQRIVGRGREFERLRDYAPGDSFDEIYWKGTARRRKPVTKVFQIERTQDVYAVLDASRLAMRNEATDRFVNAALMLALATESYGDRFGLISFSDRVQSFVPVGKGRAQFSRCRDAIYSLQPSPVSPDFDELFSFIELRVRKRSLLVFLTDLSDALLAESFLRGLPMLTRRHLVMAARLEGPDQRQLFTGPEPTSTTEIYSRLAGHLEWARTREMDNALRKHGVRLAPLRLSSAGMDLVARYFDVKQRQLL